MTDTVLMVVANTFATDARVRREARAIASHGFDVQVLCWDRQGRRPSEEKMDRCLVRNIRLGKTTVLPSSRLYYLIAALLFQMIILHWVVRQIGRARALVLHAHDFNTLLACAVARWVLKHRVRLIYDCHELTPGAYQEWYGSFISAIVGRLEIAALCRVDAIITANEAIYDHLRCHNAAHAAVIYNCPAIAEIPAIQSLDAKRKLGLCGHFVVLFSGRMRQDYDLRMILEAARDLRRNGFLNFRFVFTGPPETMEFLASSATNQGLQSLFDFRGWVESEDLLLYYIASDLCFALTRNLGANTKILTPIKLFESMACGVPVVVRDGTLSAEIVRSWNCGIVLKVERTSFSAELIRLSHNPTTLHALGEAGRKAFRLKYNWDRMQGRLLQLYAELWEEPDLRKNKLVEP